ncbi:MULTISPECIES: hypothetical protein [unclassified Pseudomonas]|uniref:hypothetical protein n=1 Tax=unclassified Pseudomonas TaxID=196821 RepID=UPI001183CE0E|nr:MULTISPECIES: hypothetical protein [unclassified Pseudomonas]
MEFQYIYVEAATSTDWWEPVLAVASGIVALCALGASLYQAYLSRLHNRLSVKPHLALHFEQRPGIYKIELRNDGIGPAIITSASLMNRGAVVPGDGLALIANAVALVPECKLVQTEFFKPDFVLPAGKEIAIATIEHNPIISDFNAYLSGHLELNITYKSAYGEKFTFDSERPK